MGFYLLMGTAGKARQGTGNLLSLLGTASPSAEPRCPVSAHSYSFPLENAWFFLPVPWEEAGELAGTGRQHL